MKQNAKLIETEIRLKVTKRRSVGGGGLEEVGQKIQTPSSKINKY